MYITMSHSWDGNWRNFGMDIEELQAIMEVERTHYLEQLSEMYPTITAASAEIINLQAILNLPKGTENFISDIHGEYDAFSHVLRNGSGAVRKKIDDVFGHTLSNADKNSLATLIYYPKQKMSLVRKEVEDMDNWYRVSLYRLIEVCKTVSSKYTRSKVRRALPKDYAYIIEELITEKPEIMNKEAYYDSIVNTVVSLGQAKGFIIELCKLIQRLVVDHLHVLGDIYDRGSGPHLIMDHLGKYHSLDIQWGNHDIIWMGAATGQLACIATVIRNSIRYGNLDVVEEGYGINMLPLAQLALSAYKNDPCERFVFKAGANGTTEQSDLVRKMHKAIAIIRFKLEGQMMKKWPEYEMQDRLMFEHINYKKGTIMIDGEEYQLLDKNFPTINPADPYCLTAAEAEVMDRFRASFLNCDKLQKHVKLFLQKGSMYKIYNGNLLYHGCIPMETDGTFRKVNIYGKYYSGKALFDVLESYVRKAFHSENKKEKEKGMDIMWYIWTSKNSPLYGRAKMATFERYFLAEEDMHVEEKNVYYTLIKEERIADMILKEFGLEGENVHIINGHVPVHRMRGEKPIKAGGKVIQIDGGFSKAYRRRTGIAGYTLIFNSYGLTLTAHMPFVSIDVAVKEELDIVSKREAVEYTTRRLLIADTDDGARIKQRIADITHLISSYRNGSVVEKAAKKNREDYLLY